MLLIFGRYLHPKRNTSPSRSVFEGVGQQVQQHLLDFIFVYPQRLVGRYGQIRLPDNPVLHSHRLKRGVYIFQKVLQHQRYLTFEFLGEAGAGVELGAQISER